MNAPDLALCLTLSDAHARMSKAIEDTLSNWHGLALEDFKLLFGLERAPGGELALTQAAAAQMLSPAALTRKVLPLEKLGWLERSEGRLRLTPVGQRQIKEAAINANHAAQRVLRDLHGEDQQHLRGLLDRLAPIAARVPTRAITP